MWYRFSVKVQTQLHLPYTLNKWLYNQLHCTNSTQVPLFFALKTRDLYSEPLCCSQYVLKPIMYIIYVVAVLLKPLFFGQFYNPLEHSSLSDCHVVGFHESCVCMSLNGLHLQEALFSLLEAVSSEAVGPLSPGPCFPCQRLLFS